jgi:hypothetical protein
MHKSLEAGTVSKVTDMNSLSDFITELVRQLAKKLVLIIDEEDASSNSAPFLNFLGMLRTKYLERFSPRHATFHSVVLAGVYDIKSLKYKLRDPEAAQFNRPWNIAVDFKVEMAFNPREIAPMLEQYSQAEGVPMDIPAIAERLYYYTLGYPFLVTRLCKIIAEDMLPGRPEKSWSLSDVEEAVQWLLKEDNTNFDSLIKNLENHPDLYEKNTLHKGKEVLQYGCSCEWRVAIPPHFVRTGRRFAPTANCRRHLPTADCRLPTADCRLPTANCQLPTADCQLPTANCQLPTADCQLPTANCQLPTANCQLPTANCQLPTANCQLPTAIPLSLRSSGMSLRSNCQLPTADCQLPTANCRLPTANCRLPTADCQLFTANYLLPTTPLPATEKPACTPVHSAAS